MYISSFHIDGFGLFSDVDVPALAPNLNIFFGHNEAGKSTCLEFLRVMLTGYPESRKSKSKFTPLARGRSGGSVAFYYETANGQMEEMRLTRRPEAEGGLSLYLPDGTPQSAEILIKIFAGVSQEVYRKVFGFSLGELESFESLSDEGVRNALYGASFGPGLRSPAEALKILRRQKDELFKKNGTKQPLNAAFLQLEELRAKIADLKENSDSFDQLCLELSKKRKELENLQLRKNDLETERRSIERHLGVWLEWDRWRQLSMQLENLGEAPSSFPEDAIARFSRASEAKDGCERQLAAQKQKLESLVEKRKNIVVNVSLLEAVPALQRLAERKSSYRQALSQINGQRENCERARSDLERGLAQLGPDWNCDRIRATDRSLFAREDLEKQAREMNSALQAHQAAYDYLVKANHDVEACENAVKNATVALESIPQPQEDLNDHERDDLRQKMARLEENRRMEPRRQEALTSTRNTFYRALERVSVNIPSAADKSEEENAASARQILDELIANQDSSLALAKEIQEQLAEQAALEAETRQAEKSAEEIKKKMDELIDAQRKISGPTRNDLDAKAKALRALRSVTNNVSTAEERVAGLREQLQSENKPRRAVNWVLITIAAIFLLCGGFIFFASYFWGLTEILITPEIQIPINLWGAYVALACGVILFAFGMPGNRAEVKKYRMHMLQLQANVDSAEAHLSDLEAQVRRLCQEAGIDSADPITLDATEMLLEREKEQCIYEERYLREIEVLKKDYEKALQKVEDLQKQEQAKEVDVQRCRKRWHGLLQAMQVNVVPSPESAATLFARAEAARGAYDNVLNSQRDLEALREDGRALEDAIASMSVIAKILESSEEIDLWAAVRQTLDACREADLIREQRIRAQATLQNIESELERAQTKQADASTSLDNASKRLETAQANWAKSLNDLGLGSALDPETAREALKVMENCLAAEERYARSQRELEQCGAELEALSKPLNELVNNLNYPLALDGDGSTDWLITLDNLLTDAKVNEDKQNELTHLNRQISDGEDDLGANEAAYAAACAKEQTLFTQAGVDNAEDFLRLANQQAERMELRKSLENSRTSLQLAAESQPFDDFLASFSNENRETQEEKLTDIQNQLNALSDQERNAATCVGSLETKVQSLSTGDELAILRQKEANLLESIERMVLAWSKRAIAESVLLKAKNKFEKERQPEVIRVASQIFAQITNNRWAGLRTTLDSSQFEILQHHGEPILPEFLSRGAQEQAYLALRLAYIRNHAEHAFSLPVIMDEILVNFDPERASRAARAFADLTTGVNNYSQQILYFTCQPHIVDILRSAAPDAKLFTVENGNISAA